MQMQCPRCEQDFTGRNLASVQAKARKHRCNGRRPTSRRNQAEYGMIKVPIGPFGIFGSRYMTPKKYQRFQARNQRSKNKRNSKSSNRKRKWIIPGIIYWE